MGFDYKFRLSQEVAVSVKLLTEICELSDAADGSLESAEDALIRIRLMAADRIQTLTGKPYLNPQDQE